MTQPSLDLALQTLLDATQQQGHRFSAQILERTTALALQLLQQNVAQCLEREDPRLVVAYLSHIEQLAHLAHRARLQLALQAAATGAHSLEMTEYDALREQRTDYERDARFAVGRPCYKTPADFLSAWLRIDYHEAAGMLTDAQLVVGRITVAGTLTTARFPQLATRWLDPHCDPRNVLQSARALNRLEPADTIAQGVPLAPAARHRDGRSLEEHASDLLRSDDPRSCRKRTNALVSKYRKAHSELVTLEEGLVKVRTVNGLDEYRLRVRGINAELLRSLLAGADKARTLAGQAARKRRSIPSTTADSPQNPKHTPAASEVATPEWLKSENPAPDWAGIDPMEANENPAADESVENSAQNGPLAIAATDLAEQIDEHLPPSLRRLNALLALLEQRNNRPPRQRSDENQDLLPVSHSEQPPTKTVEPELLVFMKLQDLQDLSTAEGVTAHGVELSATDLRQLLCRSKILPVVFGGDGQVLDLGRSSRFYPDYLKKGIIARDRGCLVPGCSQPPGNCDVHHAAQGGWQGGCPTDIRYGCLLCRNHHTAEQAGIIKVIMHQGLPHVLLPTHLDASQTPRRNAYWHSELLA